MKTIYLPLLLAVGVLSVGTAQADEAQAKAKGCFACHALEKKIVGPAYKDVAKKYAGASAAQVKVLVQKVKNGGAGNWGTVPMAAHPTASDEMLEKAVRWVLSQK